MADPLASPRVLEKAFSADRRAPRAVTAWWRETALGLGLSSKCASDAELCVDELVTNLVRHAWSDALPHTLAVRLEFDPERLAITIEDDGQPFDPSRATLPAPAASLETASEGGRGLGLVRSIAHVVGYKRRAGKNRVTLVFLRGPGGPGG